MRRRRFADSARKPREPLVFRNELQILIGQADPPVGFYRWPNDRVLSGWHHPIFLYPDHQINHALCRVEGEFVPHVLGQDHMSSTLKEVYAAL
jgi:hypothetical protein